MRYIIIGLLSVYPLVGAFWTFGATTSFDFFSSVIVLLFAIKFVFRGNIVTLPTALFALLAPICIAATHQFINPVGYNADQLLLRYLSLFSLLWLLSQSESDFAYRDLVQAMRITLVALILLTLRGLFGDFRFGLTNINVSNRVDLTFGNPNYLAAYLLICLPLFLELLLSALHTRRKVQIAVETLFVLAIVSLVFLTGSRGVILLSTVLMLVFSGLLWIGSRREWWLIQRRYFVGFVVLLLFVGSTWAFTSGQDTLQKLSKMLSGGGASEFGRLTAYQLVWELVSQSWVHMGLGSGYGALFPFVMSFPDQNLYFFREANVYIHAHSEYLEILLESGIVGFTGWIAFAGLLIRGLYRTLKKQLGLTESRELFALSISLLMLGIFAGISVATRQMVVLLPATLALGLLTQRIHGSITLHKQFARFMKYVCIIVCFLFAANTWSTFRSEWALSQARRTSAQGKIKTSLYWTKRAVQFDSGHVEALYLRLTALVHFRDAAMLKEIEGVYHQLNTVVPNYRNSAVVFANYLNSIGQYKRARHMLENYVKIRYFALSSLVDLISLSAAMDDEESYKRFCYEYFSRLIDIEARMTDSDVAIDRISDAHQIKLNRDSQNMPVFSDVIAAGIPSEVLLNPIHLKQYLYMHSMNIAEFINDSDQFPSFIKFLPYLEKEFLKRKWEEQKNQPY